MFNAEDPIQEPEGGSSNSLALTTNTTAAQNWARYMYGRTRGHDEYCLKAKENEGMYLGGGLQWSEEDKQTLLEQGRVLHEFNEIAPAVNAAIGYQIHNRMDISFKPRAGDADQQLATIRTKVAMQIADNQKLHWKETDVFSDGLIEQRGYFDLRMNYDDSVLGELAIDVLDPRDVIPDPDARDQDPDKWSDVIITRWLTLDAIESLFGEKIRKKVEDARPSSNDFATFEMAEERNRFGDNQLLNSYSEYDAWNDNAGMVQVRIIDRQKFKYAVRSVAIYPTGDIRLIVGDITEEKMAELIENGVIIDKRRVKIVDRTISTKDILLYSGDGEFPFLSVVPYFPYFRRGKTRGLVDNGVSPQQAYNKLISQYIHVTNSTANSGWKVEENSLTNMDTDDLQDDGAKTGLVIEYRRGATPPDKIQPNQVPTGLDRMIDRTMSAIREATVPEAMRGTSGPDESGVAIQSKQFASQQQLAIALDNLARTRNTLGRRIDWVITNYYDSLRIFRITGNDKLTGKDTTEEISINVPNPDGSYSFDMTAGEYDLVISEQPMQVTFENSQFTQALEMREKGVAISDKFILRYSNLADKHDIIDEIVQREQAAAPQLSPLDEARAEYIKAQTLREKAMVDKVVADTAGTNIKAQYEAIQTANQVLLNPGVVQVGDELMLSAGYKDHNGAPLVQAPAQQAIIDNVPSNTSPQFPPVVPGPEANLNIAPESPANVDPMQSPSTGIETARTEPLPQ